MTVYSYLYLTEETSHAVPLPEQREHLAVFARSLGLKPEQEVIEENCTLRQPLRQRPQGANLLQSVRPGDAVLVLRAEWMLGPVRDAARLLRILRTEGVALYSADLGCNLTLDEKRQLRVHEGHARLIIKLLDSLAICGSSEHGETIRSAKKRHKEEGRYLGGPVPFGFQVKEGVLVADVQQQQLIKMMKECRRQRLSYQAISRMLLAEHGVRLSREGVRRALSAGADPQKKERS